MTKKIQENLADLLYLDSIEGIKFYKIIHGNNHEISYQEAFNLIIDKNFYTVGFDTIIIDLDKYVAKEMTKFVMEKDLPDEGSKLIVPIIITVIILVICAVAGYLYFTKDAVDPFSEKQTNNSTSEIKVSEPVSVPVVPIVNTEPEIVYTDSDSEIIYIEDHEIGNLEKNILECNTYNEKINEDLSDIKKEYDDLLIERNVLFDSNKIINKKLKELENSVSGEITSLEKYLGVKLYEKCKEDEKLNCNRLFYLFYNQ